MANQNFTVLVPKDQSLSIEGITGKGSRLLESATAPPYRQCSNVLHIRVRYDVWHYENKRVFSEVKDVFHAIMEILESHPAIMQPEKNKSFDYAEEKLLFLLGELRRFTEYRKAFLFFHKCQFAVEYETINFGEGVIFQLYIFGNYDYSKTFRLASEMDVQTIMFM